jgi:2,3-bisphosphoglycerate-dependent phosphoglycerate mutase
MLLRHGESEWNLDNCFTRWIDVPLSIQGQEEAVAAAKQLTGYRFDQALTSRLVRATDTLRIVLAAIGQEKIPIEENQALNERRAGDPPMWNNAMTITKPGAQQVEG